MVESAVIIGLYNCKNKCLFCNPSGSKKTIDKKELKKIEIDILNQVLNLKKKGVYEVEISGCDPIEYKNIIGFIKWLKKIGFISIQLSTHGRGLHNINLVNDLNISGLDKLRIPLYGSNAKIHDSITQVQGSFDESIQGIQNIKKYAPNISVQITSLITKQNYEDILDIHSLASKYSSDFSLGIPCISDFEDGNSFAVSFKKIRPYLISLLKMDKNSLFRIIDVPFCVFGFYDKKIINLSGPPITADTYSIPKKHKSELPNIPSYRIKKRLKICNNCTQNNNCEGFYSKYLDLFDLSYLKPI